MNMEKMQCPFPLTDYPRITQAHGGGGRLSQTLIEKMFLPYFSGSFYSYDTSSGKTPALQTTQHDGAILRDLKARVAFSTDSFVVSPLFFPGGDIGKLAIYGTVNDLAMCGAEARYMSVSFILEEGLSTEVLLSVVRSMSEAAHSLGVRIVTGDTKVVERGKGDGLFITTSAVGDVIAPSEISPHTIQSGDSIILSGDLGRHGIAVLSEREGFRFESKILSDCAPLWGSVNALIKAGVNVHCLRDLTRGGLASALVEISATSGMEFEINESMIPICEEVKGASEMLGLDPLHIANEGRFVAFVPSTEADRVCSVLLNEAQAPVIIGTVTSPKGSRVWLRGLLGQKRLLDMMSGEQLPRIC